MEDKSKCSSYAASIAITDLHKQYHSMYSDSLRGFKAVSLREKDGASMLEAIIDRKVEVVLDPVFLLNKEEWVRLIHSKVTQPYIFCYFIGDVEGMRRFANKMRKKFKVPLVVVVKNIRDMLYKNKKYYDAGPIQFLSLIQNATYVCTNSYHAVIFSIIFRKNFWIFVKEDGVVTSDSRIYHLATRLGFMDRILTANSQDVQMDKEIYFDEIHDKLQPEIVKSKNYINSILND